MTPRDMAGVATAPASGTARDPIGVDVGASVVAGPGRTRDGDEVGVAESALGATPSVAASGVVVATVGRPAVSTAGSSAARCATAPASTSVSGSTLGIGPPFVGVLAGADGAEGATGVTGVRAPGSG